MICTNIKQLREAQGLSGRALARKAGINPGSLSQMERGIRVMSENEILRIESALGQPIEIIVIVKRA
jgi:transcriptional regulator with XRE-family HTH domain